MTDNVLKLSRKNIKKLIPYQSARRIGGEHGNILLNANESPVSIFFKLKKKPFNRYPECQPSKLISSYAHYVNLSCNQILATRGADEGIELLIKAFCEPGKDAIIYCPPTYDMYRINATIAGVEIKEIPTIKNTWQLDLLNIKLNLSRVKLIYICNPNNPTGNIFFKKDLIFLLNITLGQALVVIDEAYIEFSPEESMTNYLKDYPNLVVLRTLSKAFALAGIRCGFTLAKKEIIQTLSKVISPYPISIPVSDIAIRSLEKDYVQLMKNRVLDSNNNRIWLINQLKNITCVETVFESNANYVLVKFSMFEKVFETLWNKGIILRNQNEKTNLKKCIRISMGTRSESLRLIKELKIFSKKNMCQGEMSEK
ncbi:histidinol-phosphate transaminase [Buchnera aphidicola str. APS (Acyrthosiphon pisum)]|uniref:Histidinol-phosphate aminotransferase n=1 Tax=Buchnera aphidicola subsp. Acyrthosiphon pisum (strain APS) TaxID=107806 RepID=HIS8_BUCAI|nr:histidinol-phosphate transaminase [Buchnera aphidicola]P57202.1 RecName: Full=Histidinol-phosphate aminotransferase; AltName: Full=Imidazole acetol-phosphate transaminase [Buchnera aphidicola str. APS (Acyrthosiphon pisum)]pir/D84941/ histidinol-phosphate transaminase (EC 2.6.1.9) [imported] - Buchnera sp. (strain APS) [Buchnera sp. (in: enterobacteria)]BAB12820.1 histidinol-phosphate aminotransferase [Buchnera aphidicola str. APS (Acyrthosiphon pisum)]